LFNHGAYADYCAIPGRIVVENMLEVPHFGGRSERRVWLNR